MILDDLRTTFKNKYEIRDMTHENLKDAFEVMCANTHFYSKIQSHPVSLSECKEDLYTLPPHTTLDQKHYVAFYLQDKCVALLDYVESYPNTSTVYLGLFMLHPRYHKSGIGKELVDAFIKSVEMNGFLEVKLCCYQVNEVGHNFWTKMGFVTEKESTRETDGTLFKMLEMHRLCK